MNLQELIKKYLVEDDKVNEFLEEMKTNKIFTASEENLDTRYSKLKGDFDTKTREHEEATKLIEELKKSNVGNEENLNKIKDYESQVAELQKELETTKIESALKVALVNAKAKDIDYLTFKVKEKGELKLDEDGNIKGIEDTLKDVKTSYPDFFEKENKKKEIELNTLNQGKQGDPEPQSLEEALMQEYNSNKNNI